MNIMIIPNKQYQEFYSSFIIEILFTLYGGRIQLYSISKKRFDLNYISFLDLTLVMEAK